MATALLPTKLFIPVLDPDVVVRSQLVERFACEPDARVTLVSAPAGAGKTTVVASWIKRLNRPAGWLSLDALDDEPEVFLDYLIEALQSIHRGLGQRARGLLRSNSPPALEFIAATLIADLVSSGGSGVLVLDDYHAINHPDIHAVMTLLIERMPASISVVIITRSDPPLPLARLRARGQLCEVRSSDLRFEQDEVAAFMERFCSRTLASNSISTLAARTEGWVAGLQLAGLALRHVDDPDAFISGFAGTHAFVADYLTDEVLAGLPPDQQDFLVATSMLHRLTGPLCDAALGRSGSQDLLEMLSRANLFLIPLDSGRTWFRYHHLFADLLRRRSYSRLDGERPGILLRASAWCEASGMADEAIGYASEAGDTVRAADLVARHSLRALARGDASKTVRWIRMLPEEIVAKSPDHCIIAAWSYSLLQQHERVAWYARRACDLVAAGTRPFRHIEDVAVHADVILAGARWLAGEDSAAVEQTLAQACKSASGENLLLRASIEIMAANARRLRGAYEEAERTGSTCCDIARQAHSELLYLSGVAARAEGLLLRGMPQQAIRCTQAVLAEPDAIPDSLGDLAANLHAIQAFAHFMLDDLAGAEREAGNVRAAMGAGGDSGIAWRNITAFARSRSTIFHSAAPAAFFSLTVLVRILILQGRLADAADQLDELDEMAFASSNSIGYVAIQALRVRTWVAQRDHAHLQHWLQHAPAPGTGSVFWDEVALLAHARAALGVADPAAALGLIDPLLRVLARRQSRLNLVEARVLRALALHALGRDGEAARSIDQALELSAPERIARCWLDEGHLVIERLQQAIGRGQASPGALAHASALITALRQETNIHPEEGPDSLSEREREVLRLLAAGHTNQEIADQLFVALGTVKKHTHTIYQKVGARSRAQAVRRAQELQLLS